MRIASNGGTLDAPWGLAIAPASFGEFAGDLLVGNFGDGRINIFDLATMTFLQQLLGADGNPVAIDGLWALTVGNGAANGFGSPEQALLHGRPGRRVARAVRRDRTGPGAGNTAAARHGARRRWIAAPTTAVVASIGGAPPGSAAIFDRSGHLARSGRRWQTNPTRGLQRAVGPRRGRRACRGRFRRGGEILARVDEAILLPVGTGDRGAAGSGRRAPSTPRGCRARRSPHVPARESGPRCESSTAGARSQRSCAPAGAGGGRPG